MKIIKNFLQDIHVSRTLPSFQDFQKIRCPTFAELLGEQSLTAQLSLSGPSSYLERLQNDFHSWSAEYRPGADGIGVYRCGPQRYHAQDTNGHT